MSVNLTGTDVNKETICELNPKKWRWFLWSRSGWVLCGGCGWSVDANDNVDFWRMLCNLHDCYLSDEGRSSSRSVIANCYYYYYVHGIIQPHRSLSSVSLEMHTDRWNVHEQQCNNHFTFVALHSPLHGERDKIGIEMHFPNLRNNAETHPRNTSSRCTFPPMQGRNPLWYV